MTPQELVNQVDVLDDPELPRCGNIHVRRYLALQDAGEDIPEGLLELAFDWTQKQVALWEDANRLVAIAESRWPTPSVDDVVYGDAVFPPWHDKKEWLIIRGWPWAEDLKRCIEVMEEELADG